jgi:hypothetical protein
VKLLVKLLMKLYQTGPMMSFTIMRAMFIVLREQGVPEEMALL